MGNDQIELWRSEFGEKYASRDANLITDENQRRLVQDWGKILRTAISPRPQSVLEVGCNIGRNLVALHNLVPELHGVEPHPKVCEQARANPALAKATIHEGDSSSLPYADSAIDLVFTSGVLIHIAPENLDKAVDEIVRVSRRYIVCIEYFSREPTQITYQGLDGFLFKRDFGRFYLERHPNLRPLDYGFLWHVFDSADDCNWWLFEKT